MSGKTQVDLERAEARANQLKEKQREGAKAMAEYEAQRTALNDRTAKLRAARLEREQIEAAALAAAPVAKPKAKPRARKKAATA